MRSEAVTSPSTAKGSHQNKIKQTRDQANKFNNKEEEVNNKKSSGNTVNRLLRMYDPSYLTQIMLSENDPLFSPDLRLFDGQKRAAAMIDNPLNIFNK